MISLFLVPLTVFYILQNCNAYKSYFLKRKQIARGAPLFNYKDEWADVKSEYDGEKIDQFYSKRPLEVWERLVTIGSPLVGWWILRKVDSITSGFRTEEENQERLDLRAEDFKDSIVQGKSVTFIKRYCLLIHNLPLNLIFPDNLL